ncbi:MAG: SIMPL domain-containing protein [Pseudomonadota bacterium]|nr:SIMPL domain-containing protein [Pseudomonadota bacterium]MEC8664673.1 SIMPL domain-containing protein [Pseudomonadota bacterium]
MFSVRKALCVTALSMALAFTAAPANAQDFNTLLDLPEGSTLVSLSATEMVEVEQDLLVATLTFKSENADPKVVQDTINKKMKEALETAQKVDSVKVSTQQYYVHEFNRSSINSRRDMSWRGSQSLQIKGKEADDFLELAGDLQELGLTMNGLSYSLSPEKLEETRNSLLEAALSKLVEKSERTAKALGKSSSEMLQINVDMGGNHYQPPMMRGMAMESMAKAEMSAPVAAPSESQISLTVSAQALLK